jgi:hypothetical protein
MNRVLKATFPVIAITFTAMPGSAPAAGAQERPAAAILRNTFEESEDGWVAMGTSGKTSITHDPAFVKEGKGALKFDYTINKGEMSIAILPRPTGFEKAKSFRFAVHTDSATTMAFALQEAGGGRYVVMFSVPKGKWQQVEIAASDLTLSEDANDPKDANNKLDLDQVEGVAIADIAQFFASGNEDIAKLFNFQKGPHTFYLDDFVITEEALTAPVPAAGEYVVESFARPQLNWVVVGDARVSAFIGKPLDGRSMQADYHTAPGRFFGFMRRFERGKLAGKERLQFTAASVKPVRLMVQVEEKGGGKYNAMVEVPGDKAVREVSVKLTDLSPADDSNDTNGKLDLDQVYMVSILEITGPTDMVEFDNTLWINNVRAGAAK